MFEVVLSATLTEPYVALILKSNGGRSALFNCSASLPCDSFISKQHSTMSLIDLES